MPNVPDNHPLAAVINALLASTPAPAASSTAPVAAAAAPAADPAAAISNPAIADLVAKAAAKLPPAPAPVDPALAGDALAVKMAASAAGADIVQAAKDAADCVRAAFKLGIEYVGNGITVSAANGGKLQVFAAELEVEKFADKLVEQTKDAARVFFDKDVVAIRDGLLNLLKAAAS